jgi:pimeloyl-ACP methyl ester carboxylesterase
VENAAVTQTATLLVERRRHEIARVGAATPGVPTLVFLHEGLGCARLWRDFPARLAAALELPALSYSRLGYGEYGTLAQVDAIERGIAGRVERVVLAGCGHAPHRERADETSAAMVRFLGPLARGGPAQR